jgi:uncharacterized membrane protein
LDKNKKAHLVIGLLLTSSFLVQLITNWDEKGNVFYLYLLLFVLSLIANIYNLYVHLNNKNH